MDTMTATKMVGGFCGALLIYLLGNWAAEELYHVGGDHGGDHTAGYEIEVAEGQLLTFPANIIHRSPINTTDKVKTIISFNSNFLDAEVTI